MINVIIMLLGLVLLALGIALVAIPTSANARQDDFGSSNKAPRHVVHIARSVAIGIAGFVILVIGLSGPFVEVPAGNVGVVTNFGSVQPGTLEPGLHIVTPIIQHVVNVDTRVQPHEFKEIDAASSEYQSVRLTGVMNYHVDGQYASDLYQRVGTEFAAKILDPAFNDYIKTVLPQYGVSVILAKRDEIRQKAKNDLQENLAQYHIIVDDIYIANIGFSPEYTAAIEAKQVAQQQVETERQVLAQREIQAQQTVVAAQGAADSAVVTAKGQAESNRQVAASLSEPLLQYLAITKLSPDLKIALVPAGTPIILDPNTILPSPTP